MLRWAAVSRLSRAAGAGFSARKKLGHVKGFGVEQVGIEHQAATAFITLNLMTTGSLREPADVLRTAIEQAPAPVTRPLIRYGPIVPPEWCETTSISPAATVLLFRTNVAMAAAARAAAFIVISPVSLFSVTAVDLLVA